MKKWGRGLTVAVFLMGCLTAPAWAWTQTVNLFPRIFLGTIFLSGDLDSWSGSLTASNPTCTLTVPPAGPGGVSEGVGPNGSLLVTGSSECPGMFELFLSNGALFNGTLPSTGGIGNNTGVYGGTFAIVSTTDFGTQGQTVVWAGNYTQVFNIDPRGGPIPGFCGSLNFCANLGPAFGAETFNGHGLSYLLELNGFTWNVSSDPERHK
jgi:hypothetical protein